jgi:PST family polysaccharide transporter
MRLLEPEAFGLIGMILVLSGFAEIFGELGFSSALVQRPVLREDHRSTVFWLNLGMAGVLGSIMYLAAPAIAAFYGLPLLGPMSAWMSLCFLLSAPSLVPRALLQRELRFDVLAKVNVSALLVSGAAAVATAASGAAVWSLVVAQLVGAGTKSLLLLWLGGWYPRLLCSQQALRELFAYGSQVTGFKLVSYWARSADKLLIGKFIGSDALGLYSRASTLILLPVTQVLTVLGKVMFPALSSLQGDKSRVRRAFLRVIDLLTLLTFPLALGFVVVAEAFVLGLFGANWRGVVRLSQILALVGMTQALCNPTAWIYGSQGRTDWLLWWGIGRSGVFVVSIVIGLMLGGVEAVALANLVGNLIITIPSLALPGRLIGMTISDIWKTIRNNLLCATAMAMIVWGVGHMLPAGMTSLTQLAVQVVAGGIAYGALAYIFCRGAIHDLIVISRQLASGGVGTTTPGSRQHASTSHSASESFATADRSCS